MTKEYKIEEIAGDLMIYTRRQQRTSGVIYIPHEERKIQVGFFGRLFYCFLLPVSFDPLSKRYVWYESIRIVMIVITLLIVPLQVRYV